ncbi:citryl-CoA lyase [Marinobacter subterrani]|uniref:citryl-CoA lyase n=1 Tax=Marinobacter subterrani TaxID=1658765 RepID=UPI0023556B9E|nr:citryl-CoA lyase [Marinobacter subterrani]
MKIGKETIPRTSICTSNDETIVIRGKDLAEELIGKLSFTEYFLFLLTGKEPSDGLRAMTDATLIAITEHGLVPSVQASRMTLAASPEALQGAVAAGILGCGSVILGAADKAGLLFHEIVSRAEAEKISLDQATYAVVSEYRAAKKPLPGYGHPLHKARDPRVNALFSTAEKLGLNGPYMQAAELVEKVIPDIYGKDLKLNVSAAIPATLLDAGFPIESLKGIPILARTAGLLAHLREEQQHSIGFALSYQASKSSVYEGEVPDGFKSSI